MNYIKVSQTNEVKEKFPFMFNSPDDHWSLELLSRENNCICTDGYIKKLNSTLEKECYFVEYR